MAFVYCSLEVKPACFWPKSRQLNSLIVSRPEHLKRQVREVRVQGDHLRLQLRYPGSQISIGTRRRSLRWRFFRQKRCLGSILKHAAMETGQHLELLAGQAFDPGILGMWMQGDSRLEQPLA